MREETKSVLGIAYLRTIIIAIFTLISYLLLFFYSGIDKYFTKATPHRKNVQQKPPRGKIES